MARDPSRLRHKILEIHEALRLQLDPILDERGPLMRGSFGTRSRVCGKETCRCARGELHESKYLSASDGGQSRQVHVPAADEVRVAEAAARYRRFIGARAQLAEQWLDLRRRQLELVDALGQSLLEQYPVDNPMPAAGRRGRPAKEDRRPSKRKRR